jgi:hypothetical protein
MRFFPKARPGCRGDLTLFAANVPLFALGGGSVGNLHFMIAIVVLCVIVAAILGFMSLRARRARRLAGRARQQRILENFQRFITQGGRVDMFPAQREKNSRELMLQGLCLQASEQGLMMEFRLDRGTADWPHTVADVFLRHVADDGTAFYAFTVSILRRQIKGSVLRIQTSLPSTMRQEQKRSLFRVSPPSESVPALALWPTDAQRHEQDATSGRELGRPPFAYRPGKSGQLRLLDISAGGARLSLDAGCVRQLRTSVAPDATYVLLIVFGHEHIPENRQFWCKCRCRHSGSMEGNPVIGVQFLDWCVTQKVTDPIVWQNVETSGEISPLLEWLVAFSRDPRYLETLPNHSDPSALHV